MYKLYQVVNGKACLCGYNAQSKRLLVARAIGLPRGASNRAYRSRLTTPQAYVDGEFL